MILSIDLVYPSTDSGSKIILLILFSRAFNSRQPRPAPRSRDRAGGRLLREEETNTETHREAGTWWTGLSDREASASPKLCVFILCRWTGRRDYCIRMNKEVGLFRIKEAGSANLSRRGLCW